MTRTLQTCWKASDGQRTLLTLAPDKVTVHLYEATAADLEELREAIDEALARLQDMAAARAAAREGA